jgi:ubiquinone/menaquinone biosynthesis C-methylase UbiE
MDYIKDNKAAWEEAFEHRRENWGNDNYKRLMNEPLPFICEDVATELKEFDWKDKRIAQFCCNNGRELLSIMQLGPSSGIGFDIAENIIEQARTTAQKAGITNCDFVAANILEIGEEYFNQFDLIFFTIGAITWFQDLPTLFGIVSQCLKPNGAMLIHDFHPFMNMLPLPGEDGFHSDELNRIAYPYFRKEPWIENGGMEYMTPQYDSKTFTSFVHTLSDMLNSAISAGMTIRKLNEFSYDVGLTDVYDAQEYPLSFILIAHKG